MVTTAASPRRALVVGSAVTVACALPVFLTSAMAVELADDLGFDAVGIGGAISLFFGTMALTSVYLGRLVDRLGATRSLRIAASGGGLASLGIALLARSWATLAVGLVVAGLAAALGQPAANRLLVNRIPVTRLGTAFGFKQSAPPVASMLAGLSVPAIALTLGWRWAFALAAVGAVVAAIVVGARPAAPASSRSGVVRGQRAPLRDRPTLLVLAVGFGLGFTANSAVLAFYVEAAVRAGTSHQVAGLVFAAASLLAIVVRLIGGAASDRVAVNPLRLSAALLASGAVGLGLLATGRPATMAVGAVVALAGTWGFPGLFWFALVSAYPESPGRITGAMAPAAAGGMVGPAGFGAVAVNVSYTLAWGLAGLLALLAAAGLVFGAHRLAAQAQDTDVVG